ncbi:RibD family protein [Rhodopila sp.]|jgi:riboflavin-specific deaminase-like protein|uniref:RibD family protein n=1 Tax=Rhodopila sp. TaxID=2480087 RepID=UPI002BE5DA71|nr:RibD family protein [Rhodopila sp.]HVZ07320.1 RibD family protein [Rhodopila sp.]
MSRPSLMELALSTVRDAPPDRPFVVAQLGQSLDGRIATVSGDSRGINGSDALDHLHALRASVDAVVVGVGTVIADDPQLTVRRVSGRHPARVVIDPAGRAPAHSRCFQAGAERFHVTTPGTEAETDANPIMLQSTGSGIPPRRIVDHLFGLGLRRILVEGGADTLSRFLNAGMVDRLHILMAPVILGSGKAGMTMAPVATVAQALRPATRTHVFPDGDVLFDCDLRTAGGQGSSVGIKSQLREI